MFLRRSLIGGPIRLKLSLFHNEKILCRFDLLVSLFDGMLRSVAGEDFCSNEVKFDFTTMLTSFCKKASSSLTEDSDYLSNSLFLPQ